MNRTMLWLFFLADVAGVLWAVRVLVREARRHLAWWRGQAIAPCPAVLELPPDFVVIPASRAPQADALPAPADTTPLRLIG